MLVRVGDLMTIAPLARTPDVAPLVKLTARVSRPATPAPVDYCASAAAARARNSPAAPGLEAQCAAQTLTPVSKPSAVSMPVTLAPSATTGCGPEPPRGPALASGARPYADPAKGTAWLACMDRQNAAEQKALLAPIDARTAGGEGGCGPEPAFNLASSGKKFYVNSELGAHWEACRASTPAPSGGAGASSSASGSSSSPVQLAPSGGGGGGGSSGGASAGAPAVKDPTPTPADISAAWSKATLAWFAFGAVAVGGVVYFAVRKRAA